MAHSNDKSSKEALLTADEYFSTEQNKSGIMKTLKQDELHHSLATGLNEKGLQEGGAASTPEALCQTPELRSSICRILVCRIQLYNTASPMKRNTLILEIIFTLTETRAIGCQMQ